MKRFTFLLAFTFVLYSFSSTDSILPTNLKITVLDELGALVVGAKVTLYGNEEDYRNEENALSETFISNEKGQVIFKKLAPKVYFIYVEKGFMNNDGGAVQTNPLEKGKLNKVNIIIE